MTEPCCMADVHGQACRCRKRQASFATYHIRARRASDFALIEEDQQDEAEAYLTARHHYANGCDVTVTRVWRETVAEWTHTPKEGDK